MTKQSILARRLAQARARDKAEPAPAADGPAPTDLSFAQERFAFFSQLEADHARAVRPFAWRLTGPFDPATFNQAISAIVERHTILRTVIVQDEESAKAEVLPFEPISTPPTDLSNLDRSAQDDQLKRHLHTLSQQTISLTKGPILQANLIRLAADNHIAHFAIHHAAFDAQSQEIFKQEFCTLYADFSAGRSPSLSPLPQQFAHVAHAERQQLQGERLAKLERYWHQQLADAPHVLPLPTDHPRPSEPTRPGGKITFDFPAELSLQVRRFSTQQNSTLFTTLISVFYTLLQRYTAQNDILVGTPVSTRTRPNMQKLIGYLINSLVLRANLSADLSFAHLLKTVHQTTLAALDHQDYPVEKLFESLQIERDASIPPLFQVMFNLEPISSPTAIPDGPTVSPFELETEHTHYDLVLEIENDGEQLTGQLIYDRDLFETATIERMAGHYLTLLRSAIGWPDQLITQLPILTPPEQNQLLHGWNQTESAYNKHLAIHQVFEQRAAENPTKIAVQSDSQVLSYEGLNTQANRLAHHLVALNVGPDSLVGVFLDRSVEMLVGLLAILKAGGAYVPIDPNLPTERIELMLADSAVEVVLTEQKWQDSLPKSVKHPVCVDRLPAAVSDTSDQNLPPRATAESLAYMIYTSGSTGTPKGAMITQRNLHSYVHGRLRAGIYDQNTVMLHGSTLSFDIAVEEIFCPLLLGGRIVLLNPVGFKDIDGILETIAKQNVTAFSTTPSVLTQCLASPKLADCHTLNKVILGGERLTLDLAQEWAAKTATLNRPPAYRSPNTDHRPTGSGIPLINSYGPTETTVDVTTHLCRLDSMRPTVPIGRPSANCQIYIVDKHLNPLPIGVAGEILIDGDGVGRGYWNQPKLTAEKFVSSPYGDGKLYRTGDLGRFWADGNIEFLGRIDHQVKIRGFRVELGEIEAQVLAHPAVTQATVLAPELNGSKQLVAYVASRQSNTDSLRQFLTLRLPDYMVPPYLIMLDRLPLMLNGKVNLRDLPQPAAEHLQTAAAFVPAETDTEHALVAIWQEILAVEQISTNDNFFHLGGHSLLVTKVISRIRNRFDIDFPMKTFFETPKLADQAFLIEFML